MLDMVGVHSWHGSSSSNDRFIWVKSSTIRTYLTWNISINKTVIKYKRQWYSYVQCISKILDILLQYDDIFGCRIEISFMCFKNHSIWAKTSSTGDYLKWNMSLHYTRRWWRHVWCVSKNPWHVRSVRWYI